MSCVKLTRTATRIHFKKQPKNSVRQKKTGEILIKMPEIIVTNCQSRLTCSVVHSPVSTLGTVIISMWIVKAISLMQVS